MKIVFTGGCGYIGSHTALAFLDNFECEITLLDDLSTGYVQNFDFLKSRFGDRVRFLNMDMEEADSVLEGMDTVVHFGGSLKVEESVRNPLLYYTNNTLKSIKLMSACAKHKIKNFILSSTAAVYGQPSTLSTPIVEDTRPDPINPYGKSKMMIEIALQDVAKPLNMNFIILRYFNIAGACMQNDYKNGKAIGQRGDSTHLIKIASECAIGKRKAMDIFGDDYGTHDGTCIRDYTHVDDLASAHVESMRVMNENKHGGFTGIFNVGYGKGLSVKEVVGYAKRISGVDFCTNIKQRREGDPAALIASNSKIVKYTNWKPRYDSIETILKSSMEWEKFLS